MEIIDGSIRSIRLQNFFCFSALEVEFNTNVTFVIGRNGTGKSAIITALVVGLGGRASDTNRGSNVTSFIKKGTNSATVEIKIKNSGPAAYKYEEYGDYITVIKTITLSGTTNYRIKSDSGDVISRSAKEVNAIIIAHDIQVDNLISVLNQDDARAFYKQEAFKLYALYRRATKMDLTQENYNKALANCKKAQEILEKKKQYSDDIYKESQKWKKIFDQMQTREESRAEHKKLKNELIWSEILETEREVSTIHNECEKQRTKCATLEEKVKSVEQILKSGRIEALKKQLEENQVKKMSLQEELHELEREGHRMRDEWSGKQVTAKTKAAQLKREENNILEYERELQNTDSGLRRTDLERRVEEARAAVKEVRARYSTQQHDSEQARGAAARASGDVERALAEHRLHQDRHHQLQKELRELQARGGDSLAVYGRKMVTLCQRVRSAAERGEFSAAPRGPVGHYIKLRERTWDCTIEHILGKSINSFCVNTAADSRKLIKIIEEVYDRDLKPGVTCSRFLTRPHDVSRTSVASESYRSALEALQVDDPVIINYLIDNLSVEKVLLVPDHEVAKRLSDTVSRVPRNCNKIVTMDCTEYYPAPHYRSYGGEKKPVKFLHISNEERKLQLHGEIQEVERTLKNSEAHLGEAKANSRTVKDYEQRALSDLEKLFKLLPQKENEERKAIAELKKLQAPQLEALEEELTVSKMQVETLREFLNKFSSEEENYKRIMSEHELKVREMKTRLAQEVTTCRQIDEDIEREEIELEGQAAEKGLLQRMLKENNTKLAEVLKILAVKQSEVDAKNRAALAKGSRIEQPREKTVVLNLLTQAQRKMNAATNTTLSREEVERELRAASEAYRTTKKALDRLSAILEKLTKTTDKHLEYCFKRQMKVDHDVESHFSATLTGRGYSGEMMVDHHKKKLEFMMSGRQGRRAANAPASLSGGERSYAAIAFVSALWEVVDLPFYFLDEFDVFLDGVNRQIVIDFLLSLTQRLEGRQFVFLTPNRANIRSSAQVSVKYMPDPER